MAGASKSWSPPAWWPLSPVLQLVHERDGRAARPLDDAFYPEDQPALEVVSKSLEGTTARQKNPHSRGSLAFAACVMARLGGSTGYYGMPTSEEHAHELQSLMRIPKASSWTNK